MKIRIRSFAVLFPFATLAGCAPPQEFTDEAFQDPTSEAEEVGGGVAQVQQNLDPNDWTIGGNTVGAVGRIGSNDNYAIELEVNNARALRIEPGSSPNLVGGYSGNSVTSGVIGATVAGGGQSFYANVVTDNYGTVGGGLLNRAGDNAGTTSDRNRATVAGGYNNVASGTSATVGGGDSNQATNTNATVGGGYDNVASGAYATIGGGTDHTASNSWATIAGGSNNDASGTSSTVGGGGGNTASGSASTVVGGQSNTASGDFSTVLGGDTNEASGYSSTTVGGTQNVASGDYSFAAGAKANADYDGCFVWADGSTATALSCGAAYKFVARASGGVYFYSNSTDTAGVKLTAGSSAWAAVSDRNKKKDFSPVDPQDVLKRVTALPMTTWSYKAEPGVRHMGPMAQDFHAAFGLGTDDVSIVTIDADGVALAAIQGLNRKVTALETTIDKLEAQNDALNKRLARLEAGKSSSWSLAGFSGSPSELALLGLGVAGAFLVRSRKERARNNS